MKKITLMICAVLCSPLCYAEGLDTLVELGKSQEEIQKVSTEETARFEWVKRAIGSGAITKGQSKDAIKGKYGEPVIITQDFQSKREKWVYKPASSSFFKGVKIYLYFDSSGSLDETKVLE